MNRRYEVPEKKLPFDDSGSILSWADSEGSIRTSPYAVYHKVHPKGTSNIHIPPLPPPEEMYSSEIYLMQPDSVTYSESLPPKDMSTYSVPEQRKSRTWCRRLGKVFGGLLLTLNFSVCTVLAIQMFFQHRLVCKQLYYQNNTCSNCPRYKCPVLATSAPTKVTIESNAERKKCKVGLLCVKGSYQPPANPEKCELLLENHLINLKDENPVSPVDVMRELYVIDNNAISVVNSGWYLIHSRLQYNQQCSAVWPKSPEKMFNHSVSVLRFHNFSDPELDETITLVSKSRRCCDNCTQSNGVIDITVVIRLQRFDHVYAETSGPSLMYTEGKVSFLEAALLQEESSEIQLYNSSTGG
ncbi:hypothetical protein Bpfe_003981 [Biomphalaria pfeifferi]|uniref:TNF family profile domain-containing protein n=1 Tax=Biomphalaria pfeifferi TaxID=112525 RepID=A0AAD8C6P4_BIOPF|nr:hypothetical protein Bpfe_003981 [Biomphalaria pfeifferi]